MASPHLHQRFYLLSPLCQPIFYLGESWINPARHSKAASYSSPPPTPLFSFAFRPVPAGLNHYRGCIWIISFDLGSVYESRLVLSGWVDHENSTCLFRHWLNLSPNLSTAGKPEFSLASVLPPAHILPHKTHDLGCSLPSKSDFPWLLFLHWMMWKEVSCDSMWLEMVSITKIYSSVCPF